MTALLRAYPGYTYTTLMAEDAEFLRLHNIANHGRGGDEDGQ